MQDNGEGDTAEFRFGLKQRIYNYNLRKARENRGWTQLDLASRVGSSSFMISQIETLRHYPKPELKGKIADVLGLAIDTLFPEWLTEFKLQAIPPAALEPSMTLSEAIRIRLIPSQALLTSGDIDDAESIVNLDELKEALVEAMSTLKPLERQVLSLRFGLEDGRSHTLDQVAAELGYRTRERIRQIEGKALRKLRHPSRSKGLMGFL